MSASQTNGHPWIAYIGPFAFPDGGAGARRILGNAQSFVAAGYDVAILAGQSGGQGPELQDYLPGIRFAWMQERTSEHLPRGLRFSRYALMGRKTRLWLQQQKTMPAAIVLYSGYSPYLLQFTRWCKKRGIPTFFDAVEWYTATNTFKFLVSPYLWNTELAMRVLNKRLDGIIAISTYLADYYSRAGLPVALVPPSLDTKTVMARTARPQMDGLSLAYCGSPGAKDQLSMVIEAVLKMHQQGQRVTLHIAGPGRKEVMALSPMMDETKCNQSGPLVVHGQVSHAQSMNIVRAADFSIFLRNRNRVSTAGFPTKFVESLALGTPVITNLTSDLERYLHDGETGLVCASPAMEDIFQVLQKAHSMGSAAYAVMRVASRAMAENAFDYRLYMGMLSKLVSGQECL